ncbi:MAG: PorP/SprF family type IX secretion system membrane protein [Bacteroidota bacterium]|nr:PorP/SprF family type IX secretion system membrane protein [Bacteroidota bacterium]
MRFYFKIILLITTVSFASLALAQDIHFSQFYFSPLTLNPASTGNFDGKLRFMNNYRRQWDAFSFPYQTTSIGLDRTFLLKGDDKINAGFIYLNDQSGGQNLNVNKFFLSLSYHKVFNRNKILLGIQPGYVMKKFSTDGITFPDQYNQQTGYYNPSVSSQVSLEGTAVSYFDINAGLIWKPGFKKIDAEIGAAFFHLNQPSESFTGLNNKLSVRQVYYAQSSIPLGSRFWFKPHALYMTHSAASDLVFGTQGVYNFSNVSGLLRAPFIGIYMRNGFSRNIDAVIITGGIYFNHWTIGVSWDMNVSKLSEATNNHGALEFAIIYKTFYKEFEKIIIPCDVY